MAGKTATKTPPGVGKNDVKIFYTCFVICAILVGTFFYFAPPADFYECKGVNLGWVIANAKDPATHKTLYDCASVYRQGNESTLLIGFVLLYVLFQVFAIPGPPLVLSILSGALYPYFFAHGLVAISATCGATISSLISRVLGNGLLSAWGLQSKLEVFRKEVDKNKNMLFRYMVLSRVTPIPNVVINVRPFEHFTINYKIKLLIYVFWKPGKLTSSMVYNFNSDLINFSRRNFN